MALAPGAKFRPYEIVAAIGAGSMGDWDLVATPSLERSPRVASKDPLSVFPVGCWQRASKIRAEKPASGEMDRLSAATGPVYEKITMTGQICLDLGS